MFKNGELEADDVEQETETSDVTEAGQSLDV